MKTPLPKKEWASYQLAMRCLTWVRSKGVRRKWTLEEARQLGAEIRAYRNEERKTN